MPSAGSVATPKLRDTISGELRTRIFSGVLAPGTRLVERDLAEEFGVSRFPVREAVRMLTQEGLVESLPTRGSVVRHLAPEEVQAIFDVREALEPLAARLAAAQVAGGATNTLFEHVATAREALSAGDRDLAADANADFHDALIVLANSNVLRDTLSPLIGRLHWIFRQVPDLASVCAGHSALAEAIDDGDIRLAEVEALRHVMHYRKLTHNFLFNATGGAE